MEIGTIRWYGGKTREGKQNKFGFLQNLSKQEFHIKERALQGSLKKPALPEGLVVLFETDEKGTVSRVVALEEALGEQLLEAYKSSYTTTTSGALLKRLLDSDLRAEVIAFITEKRQEQEAVRYFSMYLLTETEASVYLKGLEQLKQGELVYIANHAIEYDEELDKKIAAAVASGETIEDDYELECIRHYTSFQHGVTINRDDWAVLLDDPKWEAYILQLANEQLHKELERVGELGHIIFATVPGHGPWDCFTPTQWLTNKGALALLKKNSYEYKRIQLLKLQEEAALGITPQHVKQIAGIFKAIEEADEKFVALAERQQHGARGALTKIIVDELLILSELFPYLSQTVLQSRLQQLAEKQDVLPQLVKLFETLEESARFSFVQNLPSRYRREQALFFPYLLPQEQVKYKFGAFNEQPESTWAIFSDEAKTLFVYFIAELILEQPEERATYVDIFRRIGMREENRQIKGILLILDALLINERRADMKQIYFNRMRRYIEEDILAQLTANEPVKVISILPKCTNNVPFCSIQFCEGRYYEPIKDGAYCPRARKKCTFNRQGQYAGARLTGDLTRSYEHWTLHELLRAAKIEPNMEELLHGQMSDTYPNKLAGWVNRIEELRERLKCSHRREPFRVDWGQSSRLNAVYNATVYRCESQKPGPHDPGVYISHCLCCHLTIDSRESSFKVAPDGTHYICIHCGGVEQRPDYTPGDICPACGTQERMKKMYENNNWYKCGCCGHEIKTSS